MRSVNLGKTLCLNILNSRVKMENRACKSPAPKILFDIFIRADRFREIRYESSRTD